MYDFCPYFTNDGTVGLFSCSDDDIYHSTSGALSESWQKFIIPSNLRRYIETHKSVKILDVCYGIGYNTKTALNVFVNNYLEEIKKNKKLQKKIIKAKSLQYNIEAIDTDNIHMGLAHAILSKNEKNDCKSGQCNKECIGEIYADNVRSDSDYSFSNDLMKNIDNGKILSECGLDFDKSNMEKAEENEFCKKILIDAVDSDRVLIELSPFINRGKKNKLFRRSFCSDAICPSSVVEKLKHINVKVNKSKRNALPKKFKLRKEVLIILLQKLTEQYPEISNDEIVAKLLSQKKFKTFFDKYMLKFSKFYLNLGYKYNKRQNKMAFLHNIYYRYVSRSNKLAQNLLQNDFIDLNFHANDARMFIKSTSNKYNFIFLDAFTPAKCPVLWTVDFFNQLYAKLEDDGMVLTYSSAASVRNAFLKNGFYVGKIFHEESRKFIGTIATKNKSLIEHPLEKIDIELINSKSGICYRDEKLNLGNVDILKNREIELASSNLISSTNLLEGYKNAGNK